MTDALMRLYDVVTDRKNNPQEGSYTCYLFEKGQDKILKKLGEECAETIIAAKNRDRSQIIMEASDLLYHLTVLLANEGLPISDVLSELDRRSQKIGNLKTFKSTDKDT